MLFRSPDPGREQEHVITLSSDDLRELAKIQNSSPLTNDKLIEEAIKKLIHSGKE